jgi:Holliday junction resolvasome RuvABC endonuclease subunit
MFLIDRGTSIARVVGIDPGSQTLGVAVIEFDVITNSITSTQARTFVGDKLPFYPFDNFLSETNGDRLARIQKHKQNLFNIFKDTNPISIGCESPFYSQRRPSAFGVLMEVLTAIRNAVNEYSSWQTLYIIDPPTIKKAVGAAGNADKNAMKNKVLQMQDLNFNGDINQLDEHSIDAIAVAYCRYKTLIG